MVQWLRTGHRAGVVSQGGARPEPQLWQGQDRARGQEAPVGGEALKGEPMDHNNNQQQNFGTGWKRERPEKCRFTKTVWKRMGWADTRSSGRKVAARAGDPSFCVSPAVTRSRDVLVRCCCLLFGRRSLRAAGNNYLVRR